MEPQTLDKIVSNGTIGGVLILMAWQLPTLIRLFLEHRKEVAVEMNGQTNTYATTVDKILAANKEENRAFVEKLDNRMEKIEDSLKKLADAQVANQEIIKDSLALLREKSNGQRSTS
jgi:hypothetical protein